MEPTMIEYRDQQVQGWRAAPAEVKPGSRPVLLVHGFGSTSTGSQRLFVLAAADLAGRGHAAYSFDRLGHGVSDGFLFDVTVHDEVEQVVAMIEHVTRVEGGPIEVVAHSLGGVEAVMAAARVPDQVAGLQLWSPAGVIVDDIVRDNRIQGRSLTDLDQRGYVDVGGMALGPGFVEDVRDGLDPYAAAADYPGPALVVHGTDDEVVPIEYGRRFADALPRGELVEVDGADHGWTSVPDRQLLLARMHDFVARPD